MTRFRIIAGAGLTRRTKPVLGSAEEFPNLRIETPGTLLRGKTPGGSAFWVVGTIVGRRDPSGRLHTLENPRGFVSNLIDENPPAKWNQQLEGDPVLVVVRPDASLVVCGDRFFKRDVFVQESADGCSLATDLDLLPESPARDGYDSAALAHTLSTYGYRPPKRHTIYKAVSRLGVGDVAEVSAGVLHVSRAEFIPLPYEDYADNAIDRYTDSFVDYIAAAGSPEGNVVYLSSGWDSSSILAALVRVFGHKRVTAVTGQMFYSERSGNCNHFEIDRAHRIAEHHRVKLNLVRLDYVNPEPEWMDGVRQAYRAHNIQSLTGINHAYLADAAVRFAPHQPAFAGEISDGAHNLGFAQYATIFHPTQAFREYSDKMASYLFGPTFVRELLEGRHEQDAVYQLFRARHAGAKFDEAPPGRGDRMKQMLVSFFLRNGRVPLWSGSNVRMLTPEGMAQYTETMSAAYFDGIEDATPEVMYWWYLQLYNSFHWQGSTVSTVQKMGDLFGVTAHNPYWASAVQDFLQTMPESWGRGLDLTQTKYPLKRMMREKFNYPVDLQTGPHSYTYDVDPTFNHGFEIIQHSRLSQAARKTLAGKPYREILDPACFDLAYIDGLVDQLQAGAAPSGAALNDLMSVWLLCQTGWYS